MTDKDHKDANKIGLFDGDPVASIPRADLVDVCSGPLRPQELLMMRCSRYFVIRVLNMCGKAVEYSVTIGFVHILQRPQHGNLDRVRSPTTDKTVQAGDALVFVFVFPALWETSLQVVFRHSPGFRRLVCDQARHLNNKRVYLNRFMTFVFIT